MVGNKNSINSDSNNKIFYNFLIFFYYERGPGPRELLLFLHGSDPRKAAAICI